MPATATTSHASETSAPMLTGIQVEKHVWPKGSLRDGAKKAFRPLKITLTSTNGGEVVFRGCGAVDDAARQLLALIPEVEAQIVPEDGVMILVPITLWGRRFECTLDMLRQAANVFEIAALRRVAGVPCTSRVEMVEGVAQRFATGT